MSHASRTSVHLVAATLTASLLASCAIPPREAWQQIQTRGLITYYMSRDHAPLGATSSSRMLAQQRTAPVQAPISTSVGPDRPATPPPAMLNAATMPVAQTVPDLPGYVRTPFTNPPRLVDVRGMAAGSKVVCPYTQRPFLVPGGVKSAPSSITANRPKTPAAPERPRTTTPPVANTTVAAMNKPAPSAPSVAPVAPSPVAELPYGSPIVGRPGFVNSPFAAKHQLVDVTGLPVGMEVKCPYTGKLFRVPPQ
jgi:uncharacterized Zn-finger protein